MRQRDHPWIGVQRVRRVGRLVPRTSSPTPPSRPAASAATSAARSITPPRAQLTISIPGRIASNAAASSMPRVCGRQRAVDLIAWLAAKSAARSARRRCCGRSRAITSSRARGRDRPARCRRGRCRSSPSVLPASSMPSGSPTWRVGERLRGDRHLAREREQQDTARTRRPRRGSCPARCRSGCRERSQPRDRCPRCRRPVAGSSAAASPRRSRPHRHARSTATSRRCRRRSSRAAARRSQRAIVMPAGRRAAMRSTHRQPARAAEQDPHRAQL